MSDWEELRSSAEAAAEQLRTGPREWPGRPSAQRLAFFLAATPEVVLRLIDEVEGSRSDVPDPAGRAGQAGDPL